MAGERKVLKGVCISVPPGTSCAIVGASGSGKSTLLRLLMRLYDVSSGKVVPPAQAWRAGMSLQVLLFLLAVIARALLPALVWQALANSDRNDHS